MFAAAFVALYDGVGSCVIHACFEIEPTVEELSRHPSVSPLLRKAVGGGGMKFLHSHDLLLLPFLEQR